MFFGVVFIGNLSGLIYFIFPVDIFDPVWPWRLVYIYGYNMPILVRLDSRYHWYSQNTRN